MNEKLYRCGYTYVYIYIYCIYLYVYIYICICIQKNVYVCVYIYIVLYIMFMVLLGMPLVIYYFQFQNLDMRFVHAGFRYHYGTMGHFHLFLGVVVVHSVAILAQAELLRTVTFIFGFRWYHG